MEIWLLRRLSRGREGREGGAGEKQSESFETFLIREERRHYMY